MKKFAAIVLAAGQGKRMNSDLPKVLHRLSGKPLLLWVIETARAAGAERIVVVVGYGREQVAAILPRGVERVTQEEQLGTGHAVRCAEEPLKDYPGPIVVLSGDVPLLRAESLKQLVERQVETDAAAVVMTAQVRGEHAYGRIVRDGNGAFVRIVEHKDATPRERKIDEINSGTWVFGGGRLFPALARLGRDNAQGEYYLTDTVELLAGTAGTAGVGGVVETWRAASADECLGINTPEELAAAESVLATREAGSTGSTGSVGSGVADP